MAIHPLPLPAADLAGGVAFLKTQLAKPVTLRGVAAQALAETAIPFNQSRWFWTDDNAKALELLAQPPLRNADPGFTDAILDFVLGMSSSDMIWRRLAEPQLQLRKAAPEDFHLVTAFHNFTGDLSRGRVCQAGRFNDDRGRVAAFHTGNLVEFRLQGRNHCIDVEDSITAHGIVETTDGATLFHESTLEAPIGLFGGTPGRIATLRYEYDIRADSPVMELRVTLRAEPGITLKAVRITTACDGLSDAARTCRIGQGERYTLLEPPATGHAYVHTGPFRQLVVQEGGLPGYAHALHIQPRQPELVRSIGATVAENGRLHWCLTRYETAALADGAEFAIAEGRLLVTGGTRIPTPGVEAPLRDPAGHRCIDPSSSYDHGAELNAVATYWANARRGAYHAPVDPARLAMLQAWFDRHMDGFFTAALPSGGKAAVFVRGLAFVILALDTMHRASGELRYRVALKSSIDLLLGAQQEDANDGLFFDSGSIFGHLDCHAAAILALATLVRPGCDARLAPALRRALLALRLGTIGVQRGGLNLPYDTITIRTRKPDGQWYEEGAFWTYKAALLLRALSAVRDHCIEAGQGWLPEEWERIAMFSRHCRERLAVTARQTPHGIEHLTSPMAGETNSETQPWVLLALLMADQAVPVAEQAA